MKIMFFSVGALITSLLYSQDEQMLTVSGFGHESHVVKTNMTTGISVQPLNLEGGLKKYLRTHCIGQQFSFSG